MTTTHHQMMLALEARDRVLGPGCRGVVLYLGDERTIAERNGSADLAPLMRERMLDLRDGDFAGAVTPQEPTDCELATLYAPLGLSGGTFEDPRDVADRLGPALQGCKWSPNGEARALIAARGLSHTSMSPGDVYVGNDGSVWILGRYAFARRRKRMRDEQLAALIRAATALDERDAAAAAVTG